MYIQWNPSPIHFFWELRTRICQFCFTKNPKHVMMASIFFDDQIRFGSWSGKALHPSSALRPALRFFSHSRLSLIPTAIGEWPLELGICRGCFWCILCFMFHASRFASQIWSSEKHTIRFRVSEHTKSLILTAKGLFSTEVCFRFPAAEGNNTSATALLLSKPPGSVLSARQCLFVHTLVFCSSYLWLKKGRKLKSPPQMTFPKPNL